MLNIIDLVGNSDTDGNPIGHPIKVITQFRELLKEYDLNIILPSNYRNYITAEHYYKFRKRIMRRDAFSKIYNLIYKSISYLKVLKKYKSSILFINTDIYLLFAIAVFKKKEEHKVFAVVYLDYLKTGSLLKRMLVKRAYRNINLIITNENVARSIATSNKLVVPDYFYIEDQYKIERRNIKFDFLIVGIMSDSKNLEDVLEAVHTKRGLYSLKICGRFDDTQRFKLLADKYNSSGFISIENEYIDDRKYKQLFSETRYLVLPYDVKRHSDRSSGVFYDSMYFKTPVIATRTIAFKVLEERGMGILYNESFSECFDEVDNIKYLEKLKNINVFCQEHSMDKYREFFKSIL